MCFSAPFLRRLLFLPLFASSSSSSFPLPLYLSDLKNHAGRCPTALPPDYIIKLAAELAAKAAQKAAAGSSAASSASASVSKSPPNQATLAVPDLNAILSRSDAATIAAAADSADKKQAAEQAKKEKKKLRAASTATESTDSEEPSATGAESEASEESSATDAQSEATGESSTNAQSAPAVVAAGTGAPTEEETVGFLELASVMSQERPPHVYFGMDGDGVLDHLQNYLQDGRESPAESEGLFRWDDDERVDDVFDTVTSFIVTGEDAETDPLACTRNGVCIEGVCACRQGWMGTACHIKRCQKGCNNKGICNNGTCICNAGYAGKDCSISVDFESNDCPHNCSGHGMCHKGKCFCHHGRYFSEDCSKPRKFCVDGCALNGHCDYKSGMCICNPGRQGEDCGRPQCLNNCSARGECRSTNALFGQCICADGWTGPDCSDLVCDDPCSGNGQCLNGQCFCSPGFGGRKCATGVYSDLFRAFICRSFLFVLVALFLS